MALSYRRIGAVIFGLSALFGCAPKYTVHGVTYADPEKALEAERNWNREQLKSVAPLAEPVAERALVILPDHGVIMASGLYRQRIVGNPDAASQRSREWVLQTIDIGFDFAAEVLQKRGAFREVTVQRSDKPEEFLAHDYDAILYLSPDLNQWFMKIRSQAEPVPVYIDQSKETWGERYFTWAQYIEKVLGEK
jgi:hypothetical protein